MKYISLDSIVNQKKFYSHAIFLLVSISISIYTYISSEGDFYWKKQLVTFLLVFTYIEVFIFLAQKIFSRQIIDSTDKKFLRKISTRFLFYLVICFLAALMITLFIRYVEFILSGMKGTEVVLDFFRFQFSTWYPPVVKGLTFGAAIFIFIQLMESLKRGRQLKDENLNFQNETLKNQINPHFLFNSLNTLSSLIGPNPDLAEIFIHKFSEIYRYILDNIKKDKVPLELELNFVSDFFELHKIRDQDKIIMNIDRKGAELYWIPPVSLQILVENAIKHNMATRENPLSILVYIENNQVIVRNNLQKMAHQLASTQTGLKNLNERIKLISNKELIIEETMSDFSVKLPLLS